MRINGSHLKRWILKSDHNFSLLPLTLYQEHILMFIFRLIKRKNWDENGTTNNVLQLSFINMQKNINMEISSN